MKALFVLEYEFADELSMTELRDRLLDAVLITSEEARPLQVHIVPDGAAASVLKLVDAYREIIVSE